MEYYVTIKEAEYPVKVSLKKMKQVRLKVFPSGEIKLSAPVGTPDDWITDYLSDKTAWIEEKLEAFRRTRAVEKEEHFSSGTSTRILGQQLTVQVTASAKKQIQVEDGILHVFTSETEQTKIDRQVNNWWQQSARRYFAEIIDRLYPVIEKHGVERPTLCVKKMSTLWGSCSRKNQKVNLNYYLYKASIPCVEYVILHELTHFLYPHHNKDFYDFLTIHMPDWQERKKQLDYEFVLGI